MNQTKSGPGAIPEGRDYNNITNLEHARNLLQREKRRVKGLAKTVAILKHDISVVESQAKRTTDKLDAFTGKDITEEVDNLVQLLKEGTMELLKFRTLYKKKSEKLATSKMRVVGIGAVVKKLEKRANLWRGY